MEQAAKPTETPKPKSRTMLIAIVIIILIGVGGAVYYLTRPSGTPPPPAGLQIAIWDGNTACIQTASPPDCGFNTPGNPNVTTTASTTIQWINNGGQAHTATSCDQAKVTAYTTTACPVTNAPSLTTFDSGSIAKSGGTWPTSSPYQSLTAGTYYYFCTIHIWMHGKIIVQ